MQHSVDDFCSRMLTPVTDHQEFPSEILWSGQRRGARPWGWPRLWALASVAAWRLPMLLQCASRCVAVAAVAVAVAVERWLDVGVAVAVGVGVGVPPPTAARMSTRPQP